MRTLIVLSCVVGVMIFFGLRANSNDSLRHKIILSEERDPDGNIIVLTRRIISHSTQLTYSLASYEETIYFGDDRTHRKEWTKGMIELSGDRRRVFDFVTETFDRNGRLETRFTGSFEHGEKKGIWEHWNTDGTLRSQTLESHDVKDPLPSPRQRRGKLAKLDDVVSRRLAS